MEVRMGAYNRIYFLILGGGAYTWEAWGGGGGGGGGGARGGCL